ncbi:MAG: hypothetical protein ACN6RA_10395, partial [Stenotrophomonas maltophilia]
MSSISPALARASLPLGLFCAISLANAQTAPADAAADAVAAPMAAAADAVAAPMAAAAAPAARVTIPAARVTINEYLVRGNTVLGARDIEQ